MFAIMRYAGIYLSSNSPQNNKVCHDSHCGLPVAYPGSNMIVH